MKTILKYLRKGAMAMMLALPMLSHAQSHGDHLMLSLGGAYPKTLEASVAYERETKYHHAWEYFASYSLQYDKDEEAGHITPNSFWRNYNSWGVGVAYKPCVKRGRNHHGSLRIGASAGSDLHKAIGAAHIGYEHTYNLYSGWSVFFALKEDITIRGKDRFKTGAAIGLKIPL